MGNLCESCVNEREEKTKNIPMHWKLYLKQKECDEKLSKMSPFNGNQNSTSQR